jgi:hypothetical protein
MVRPARTELGLAYYRSALDIIDYIDQSTLRRAQAARVAYSLGGAVVGMRLSLLALPQEFIARDVNTAVTRLGGIWTTLEIGPEQHHMALTQWRGPSSEHAGADTWLGWNPGRPTEIGEVTLCPMSLRQELMDELSYLQQS